MFYLFGGECFSLGMRKNSTMMGFFCLLQRNQSFSQKEKWFTGESFVLLTLWGHEKQGFFTCLVFKGFASRNKLFYEAKKKNNFKKNFVDRKAKSAKKNKMLASSLPFFQNTSKNNRSPALAFVFSNQQPKSSKLFCVQMRNFFSMYFLFTRKQSSQQTNCFFCKQNHFQMRNRNQAKKKLNWSFCFFVDSFFLLQPQTNQKMRFYKSEETTVRTTHSLCLKFEKLF